MSLKNKIFGFGVASILALSMTTGVMAEDIHSADGKADLLSQNNGECTASFADGSFDFGDWTWNGNEYVPESGATSPKSVTGTVNTPDGATLCDITVTFDGLSYTDTSSAKHDIGLSYFSGGIANQPGVTPNMNPVDDGTFQFNDVPTATVYLFLQLNDVPDTIPAGLYEGDLMITSISGQ